MRQLQFFRHSQARSYEQAKNDGALYTIGVNSDANNFSNPDLALTRAMENVLIAVDMMDGNEEIGWALRSDEGFVLFDTKNIPMPVLTDQEQAFCKAFMDCCAITDGKSIEEFVVKHRDPEYDGDHEYPTAMGDCLCLWNAAKRYYTKGGAA